MVRGPASSTARTRIHRRMFPSHAGAVAILATAAVLVASLAGCVPPVRDPGARGDDDAARERGAVVPARRPNLLFVLIDDLGYADFSATGGHAVATPNIDRLAGDGLLMTRFYVAAPICSASRAGFMTGRFPARDGFVSFIDGRRHNIQMGQADWLDPSLPTLPRALQRAGYATGHFGKWHLGGGRDVGEAPLPAAYGFDESYTQFEGLGPRVLMTEDHYGLASKSARLGQGPIDRLPKSQITARYIDKLLDFVARAGDRPWFAQLWLDDVHDPYSPSTAQLEAVAGKGRSEDERRFLATLVAMDAQIGRLADALARSGELDDTLLVIAGDNGPTAAAHYYHGGGAPPGDAGPYRGRKGSLYEGGIREPLIVRWPGQVPAGRRDGTTIAGAVDLFPTLAAIAGAPPPPRGDGIDLQAAWRGAPIARRPPLLWAYGDFGEKVPLPALARDRSLPYAIRSGRWKLFARGDGRDAALYDLDADPGETRDLAASRPDVAGPLAARIAAWRATLPARGWRSAEAGGAHVH